MVICFLIQLDQSHFSRCQLHSDCYYLSIHLHVEGGKNIARKLIPCTEYTRTDIPLYYQYNLIISPIGPNKSLSQTWVYLIIYLL